MEILQFCVLFQLLPGLSWLKSGWNLNSTWKHCISETVSTIFSFLVFLDSNECLKSNFERWWKVFSPNPFFYKLKGMKARHSTGRACSLVCVHTIVLEASALERQFSLQSSQRDSGERQRRASVYGLGALTQWVLFTFRLKKRKLPLKQVFQNPYPDADFKPDCFLDGLISEMTSTNRIAKVMELITEIHGKMVCSTFRWLQIEANYKSKKKGTTPLEVKRQVQFCSKFS